MVSKPPNDYGCGSVNRDTSIFPKSTCARHDYSSSGQGNPVILPIWVFCAILSYGVALFCLAAECTRRDTAQMVSTYLSYDLINRDLKASLSRVGQQPLTARQTEYYKENIGKVKTVDEFLNDYQLYNYAMEAFGLSEMSYAKAFMKQVLESDLNDSNSFANKLTDTRYRQFAEAFNFSTPTTSLQSDAQLETMIGLYNTNVADADAAITEENRYYNVMIKSIDHVDKLMQNDRLRSYVLSVFGIDQQYFSYANIKGLLTSDTDDPNSYFNTQYKTDYDANSARLTQINATLTEIANRATAIIKVADMNTAIGKVDALQVEIDAAQDELDNGGDAATLNAKIDDLKAQQTAVWSGVGVADRNAAQAAITSNQALIDDYDTRLPPEGAETTNLVTALNAEKTTLTKTNSSLDVFRALADAFDFNADGTVTPGQAQTEENRLVMNNAYILTNPRSTIAKAELERDYFASKINSITSVEQIAGGSGVAGDARLLAYIQTAFNLNDVTIMPATIKNILTADLNDPSNYIATVSKGDERYIALRNAFNFQTDGTIAAGTTPQTSEQTRITNIGYMSYHNDKDEEADEKALAAFKTQITTVTSLSTFMTNSSVYTYALKAVGLDPTTESERTIKMVLQSDLQDPKSFVYTLKDDRYVKLAELFNFKSDGSIGAPILAQSELDVQTVAAAYINGRSAFGTEDEKKVAKLESEYYTEEIQKVKSLEDLLGNARLLAFAMEAFDIDPASVTTEQLYKIFTSDLDDPKSYINAEVGTEFRRLVTSFNFDTEGKLMREDRTTIQNRSGLYETLDNYLMQMMETQAGEDNAGVRLALYFQRMAKDTTSYFAILGDTALQKFINTTFEIPDELANADVDTQVKMMERYFDIEDFQDEEKLKKLISRFTVMYDMVNGSYNPTLAMFSGNTTISADTLMAVATLGSSR